MKNFLIKGPVNLTFEHDAPDFFPPKPVSVKLQCSVDPETRQRLNELILATSLNEPGTTEH